MADIDEVESGLRLALADIKRASSGGSKMGAFILGSCLIDALTGFRTGRNSTGEEYRITISKYFDRKYIPANLYSHLRCQLVHAYSEGGSYKFTDGNPAVHLKEVSAGSRILYLNLENFIDDLENMIVSFISDAKSDRIVMNNLRIRYSTNKIIKVLAPAPAPGRPGNVSGTN